MIYFLAGIAVSVVFCIALMTWLVGKEYRWWSWPLVLLVAFAPALAFAQSTLEPTPAVSLLASIFTPGNIVTAAGVVLSLVGGFAWFTANWKRRLALATYHAFHIVEDIGNEKEGDDGFDKTARALAEVNKFFVTNGWRPPKPGELELAKLQLSSLHGAEVAKAKVAIAAATAAVEAAAPVAVDARPTAP